MVFGHIQPVIRSLYTFIHQTYTLYMSYTLYWDIFNCNVTCFYFNVLMLGSYFIFDLLLSCYLTLTFTRIPDNEWILLVMFYFFQGSVVHLTCSLFYLYSLTHASISKLNQCSIWGGAYFPITDLIDQWTVLLLQQRPLGECIVSNPSQLETISSFCLILINI